MSIIPDCTLTTACFCVHEKNNNSFSIEKIIENSEELLRVPCYLVIYGDNKTIPLLKEIREKNGLVDLTKFITLELSQLWTYAYESKVNENRNLYWPTRDPRAQTDSHLITCNKFDFVLQVINSNPFNTSKFGWVDCFLRTNSSKICENYNVNKFLYVLNNINEKYHIQVLNCCDKKYKQSEFKREYYEQYRWVVCGCLFTCGKEIGIKILTRLKEIFVETTNLGYGHGDEMLYLEVLDEFYDDIHRSYGDYGQILNNFIEPTNNYHYIYWLILNTYQHFGYNKECYDCAKILLKQIESYKVEMNWGLYMSILFSYYVSATYINRDDAINIAKHIYSVCYNNHYMKKEFCANYDFYVSQLNIVYQFSFWENINN